MTDRTPRVDLIPWDYDSDEHIERMYQQRLACGWRSDEVREKWVGLGRAGRKTLYWVVSRPPSSADSLRGDDSAPKPAFPPRGEGVNCSVRGWDGDDFDNVSC